MVRIAVTRSSCVPALKLTHPHVVLQKERARYQEQSIGAALGNRHTIPPGLSQQADDDRTMYSSWTGNGRSRGGPSGGAATPSAGNLSVTLRVHVSAHADRRGEQTGGRAGRRARGRRCGTGSNFFVMYENQECTKITADGGRHPMRLFCSTGIVSAFLRLLTLLHRAQQTEAGIQCVIALRQTREPFHRMTECMFCSVLI